MKSNSFACLLLLASSYVILSTPRVMATPDTASTNTMVAGTRFNSIAQVTPIDSLTIPANVTTPANVTIPANVTTPANVTSDTLGQGALGQVTTIDQLSDVQPTDWAFQALQSLVERYGCIAGYPDGTYRGNRALTRYEFAAGLNACLDRISELIASTTADLATKEDLATLQRLQEEFATELATLRGRVDALEARTAELEANQFSTTTKLQGEVIFGLVSVIDGDRADGTPAQRTPTLGYRVRLNLNTSFSGEDLLTARLQANNIPALGGTTQDADNPTGVRGLGVLGTNMGRVEFDGDSNNQVQLALLRYRFPVSDNTDLFLAGVGNGFVDLDASSQLNPYFDGGAVSLFALRNPIYNYSAGAGVGLRHRFGTAVELNLGYLVPNASDPTEKNGLFNGQYGALAQVIFNLSPDSRIGLTYINAYAPFGQDLQVDESFVLGATGSNLANSNFGEPVSINAYGVSGTFQVASGFAIGGWVGYAHHRYVGEGDGDVWNWAVTLAFPDLFGEGNLGGLFVGQEPRLARSDLGFRDRDSSLHLEAFYRYRINDNIAITPGVIWITNPDFNQDNQDAVIGVVRTVFYF